MPTPRVRTISRAVEILGSARALAEVLRVDLEQIHRWTAGVDVPHDDAYMAALDIVAAAPFAVKPAATKR